MPFWKAKTGDVCLRVISVVQLHAATDGGTMMARVMRWSLSQSLGVRPLKTANL